MTAVFVIITVMVINTVNDIMLLDKITLSTIFTFQRDQIVCLT